MPPMPLVTIPLLVAYLGLLLAAGVRDVRERRIPNTLVIALALCGAAAATLVSRAPLHGLGVSLAGVGVGLLIWSPSYLLGAMGAGDLKFFAAGCALLGAGGALEATLLTALAGGVLAMVELLRRRAALEPQPTPAPALPLVAEPSVRRTLPYGVAMAVGLASAAFVQLRAH